MGKTGKGFIFFHDWKVAFQNLPPEDGIKLLLAMIDYSANDTPPPQFEGLAEMAAAFIFPALYRYKQSVINGRKGGEISTGKPPQEPPQDSPREPPQEGTHEGTTTTIRYDTSNNNDTDTIRSNDDTGFIAFWSAYPYKVRKATAQQVWEQLKPDEVLFATIMRALDQQKRSSQWTKDNGQYIPNPAKWLSERRWEDKLPEVPATESGTFNTTEFAEAALAKTLRDFEVSD